MIVKRHRLRTRVAAWLVLAAALVLGANLVYASRAHGPSLPPCVDRKLRPCLGPAQIRRAYDVDAVIRQGHTGKSRTIAIIVSFGSPTIRADLHDFDQAFGLPDPELTIMAPLGSKRDSHTGWASETTLDVEWAHVMAPDARILVLTSPVDETEGIQGLPQFLTLERLVVQRRLADVISQSWAATEDTLLDRKGRAMVAQFHAMYSQAAKEGISVVGATGDDGTAGLDMTLHHMFPFRTVQWPASDPIVLAVGGTQLSPDGGEVAWSGSGGGFSKLFSEPLYQEGMPAATQRLLRGRRGLPDVALDASPRSPILIYQGGRWRTAAGTSASTPQWAGLLALADDVAGRDLGDVHSALYRLALSSRYGADLRDITRGSLSNPKGVHAAPLRAAAGWDPATGLGSPRASSLLPDLAR